MTNGRFPFICLLKKLPLLYGLIFSIAYSQNSNSAKIDSLKFLISADAIDTAKVHHLTQLCAEYSAINHLDTSIYFGKEAVLLANSLVQATQNPDELKSLKNNLALNHENIGLMYSNKSDFKDAMFHFKKAIEINSEMNNRHKVAVNLNDIGNVYYYQGDFVKTLQCFFYAFKINVQLGDKRTAGVNLNNIGNVYFKHEDYTTALNYFSKGLDIFLEIGFKRGIAAALSNVGNVYLMKQKTNVAIDYYTQSLKVYEELEDKYGMALSHSAIASGYSDNGNYSEALEHYENALEINTSWGHKNGIAVNMRDIASLFLKQKKYVEAEEYFLKGLHLAIEIGELPVVRDFNQLLSELYNETGNYKLAYQHHLQFMILNDSLFNDDKSKEIGKLEMKHEIELEEMERIRVAEEELKAKTFRRNRRHLLQYSAIMIGLMVIAMFILILGYRKVSPRLASAITFFSFLLLFEFFLVLLDPWIDGLSKGEPALKLFFNAGIALCIFPAHAFFERLLKKRLIRRTDS